VAITKREKKRNQRGVNGARSMFALRGFVVVGVCRFIQETGRWNDSTANGLGIDDPLWPKFRALP
jgi:hypothetical protein